MISSSFVHEFLGYKGRDTQEHPLPIVKILHNRFPSAGALPTLRVLERVFHKRK